jgi:hypothetical protein
MEILLIFPKSIQIILNDSPAFMSNSIVVGIDRNINNFLEYNPNLLHPEALFDPGQKLFVVVGGE